MFRCLRPLPPLQRPSSLLCCHAQLGPCPGVPFAAGHQGVFDGLQNRCANRTPLGRGAGPTRRCLERPRFACTSPRLAWPPPRHRPSVFRALRAGRPLYDTAHRCSAGPGTAG